MPSELAIQAMRDKSSTFALLDRQTGGFGDWLAERRKAGKSYARIAMEIALEFGAEINASTIRLWTIELGIDHPTPVKRARGGRKKR